MQLPPRGLYSRSKRAIQLPQKEKGVFAFAPDAKHKIAARLFHPSKKSPTAALKHFMYPLKRFVIFHQTNPQTCVPFFSLQKCTSGKSKVGKTGKKAPRVLNRCGAFFTCRLFSCKYLSFNVWAPAFFQPILSVRPKGRWLLRGR